MFKKVSSGVLGRPTPRGLPRGQARLGALGWAGEKMTLLNTLWGF